MKIITSTVHRQYRPGDQTKAKLEAIHAYMPFVVVPERVTCCVVKPSAPGAAGLGVIPVWSSRYEGGRSAFGYEVLIPLPKTVEPGSYAFYWEIWPSKDAEIPVGIMDLFEIVDWFDKEVMKEKHVRARIEQCLILATLSNCPRRKFGALLIDPVRNQVISEGYNGGPRGGGHLCGGDPA